MRTRLLERIANLEIANKKKLYTSHETELKYSIKNYLLRLLNSRRGEAAIDPYYGMPSMANIAGSIKMESNAKLEHDIIEQIQLYEKRFTEPSIARIEDSNDSTDFRYELKGMINVGLHGVMWRQLILELNLSSSGRITLEEKRGL